MNLRTTILSAVISCLLISSTFGQNNISYEQLVQKLRQDLLPQQTINTNAIPSKSLFPESWGPWPKRAGLAVGAMVLLILIGGSVFTVSTQEVAVIERFGKFKRTAKAGLRFKVPIIDSIADRLSMMLGQHSVKFESITKDKVSVVVCATIQYKIAPGREYDAYYLLDDPNDQIAKFFFDIMRAQVPVLTLDDLYASKDSISNSATTELKKDMDRFAYEVDRVLLTSIDPDDKVKAAMNDINAAQRESHAAAARGEAAKIIKIKEAEAQAESDKLRGTGIANQRIEIARGMQQSVGEIKAAVPTANDADILALLMMVQYIEMVERFAGNDSKVILLPHSPGAVTDLRRQITEAILTGQESAKS